MEHHLEQLIRNLLVGKEYVEFLVGQDSEFDQLVSSLIRRCKRNVRDDNSTHVWVLPYPTAAYRMNVDAFLNAVMQLWDISREPTKHGTGRWIIASTWWCSVSSMNAAVHGRP